ncbi:hypothetical protein B0T18DRAFT_428639 [Schizothecium vesticola]|uniref:Uncharacterized protein n=1 Tax=Schizothecium vesticola TaxID=314040 RepID=A0AA40EU49_9PEZI|nr:hypothetical protein B0T18DRAFT_428639 [Schizothecium vesticola]
MTISDEDADAQMPKTLAGMIPHPPPAPTLVMTPAPQPPPDLSDPDVFKAACKEDRAICRARTLQFSEAPLYAEAGPESAVIDWYDIPNTGWTCRIPGCKKYGKSHSGGANLLKHFKSTVHVKLGRNPRPPPIDLSTPYTFTFVAPPPVIRKEGVISWDDLWAQKVAWKEKKEKKKKEEEKKKGEEEEREGEREMEMERDREREKEKEREKEMEKKMDGDVVMSDDIGANVPYWRKTGEVLDSEAGSDDIIMEEADTIGAYMPYWKITGEVRDSEEESIFLSEDDLEA